MLYFFPDNLKNTISNLFQFDHTKKVAQLSIPYSSCLPNMSQTNISSDDGNIELGASLLISGNKYNKKWRKSLYVGIMISLKKSSTFSSNYEESASSLLYTSLPHSPPARTSSAKSFVSIDVVSHVQEEEREEDNVVEERVRTDIARIVKEKDSKSLLELGGVGKVSGVLHGQTQHSSEVY